jgi:predicted membrane protein
MAKQKGSKVLNFVAWLTGVIVSLAVGSGLIGGTLSVPYIGIVNVIAGWIVVVITVLGVILALLKL